MVIRKDAPVLSRCPVFPHNRRHEVLSAKHFVAKDLEIMNLVVVYGDPKASVLVKSGTNVLSVSELGQPLLMASAVVVVGIPLLIVIRRIYVDASDAAGNVAPHRLKSRNVVAMD